MQSATTARAERLVGSLGLLQAFLNGNAGGAHLFQGSNTGRDFNMSFLRYFYVAAAVLLGATYSVFWLTTPAPLKQHAVGAPSAASDRESIGIPPAE